MAVNQNQKNRKSNPMLTKTGKTRLGPLNFAQLTKLLETSTKPKEKDKIQRALNKLTVAPA
jgi:Ca2+-binding EF-hand superfamily protein